MTIDSLDVLLFLFGTSLLFHVQFWLFLLDLHTDFSGGRSGGLVFPSLSEFSQFIVIHTVKGFGIVNKAKIDVFSGTLLLFPLMIQRMLANLSLVPMPFLKPAWTSGSSRFTYCWSLAWRILSITLRCSSDAPPTLAVGKAGRHPWRSSQSGSPFYYWGNCRTDSKPLLFQVLKTDCCYYFCEIRDLIV